MHPPRLFGFDILSTAQQIIHHRKSVESIFSSLHHCNHYEKIHLQRNRAPNIKAELRFQKKTASAKQPTQNQKQYRIIGQSEQQQRFRKASSNQTKIRSKTSLAHQTFFRAATTLAQRKTQQEQQRGEQH